MKKILVSILIVLIFPFAVFAETCPVCGAELPPTITIQVEKYPDGQMKRWTEITKDSYGTVLGKRVDEYTYQKTGEVNQIWQRVYSEKDEVVKDTKITHETNGKPFVTETGKEKEVVK